MADYDLRARAERDLLHALRVSRAKFGADQAERNLESFEACFATLGEKPNPGTRYDNKRWWVRCGSHVVVYRVEKQRAVIVRELHHRQLPVRR